MTRRLLLLLYVVVCLAALTWPGYAWIAASVNWRPLGLPFVLVWHVGWVLATMAALLAFHLTSPGNVDR